ncbi:MAG: sigma-70 family RNA polymerase sigma factor [Acidobacteriota bacterium]|jgi:RNA polymerase sigma factor (TIGR02999 family)
MDEARTITRLLDRWRQGDEKAFDELLPLVYEELRRVAGRQRRGGETLRPTALVHEAYMRLKGHAGQFENRIHFFAAAATTMRRLLVDHARARGRLKRGGGAVQVELDEGLIAGRDATAEVLALDEALEKLAALDPRKARIVELRFFAGLNYDEIAAAVGSSPATVGRDLRFARAWLKSELMEPGR